jgi:preprotein translocase subunit SecD
LFSFSYEIDLGCKRGTSSEGIMLKNRRRSVRLYAPVLAITLVLVLALLDVPWSTAEMMPGVVTFQATLSASPEDVTTAGNVLEERLSSYLNDDARLSVAVEGNNLIISLSADTEPSAVVAEASRTGRVELVDGGTEFLPLDRAVKTGPRAIPDQDVYRAVLSSLDFETAQARLGGHGRPVIEFVLTPAGDVRLAAHTDELQGYYLCLVVDNLVENCPILRTPLTNRRGTIELTGDATLDDARMLAALIRSGPLPVSLELARD